jgi:hypothetical protein
MVLIIQGLGEKAAVQNVLAHVISKVVAGVADAMFGMAGDNHSRTTFNDLRDASGIVHVPTR